MSRSLKTAKRSCSINKRPLEELRKLINVFLGMFYLITKVNELMADKKDDGMCGGMCKTCGVVMSLIMIAGGALLYMGNTMYAGALLIVFGLGKLVHKMGFCPMCK